MSKNITKSKIESTNDNVLKILSAKDLGLSNKPEKVSSVAFANWVRVLLQNWRQGTVGCKDRSEVAYSNKKPWKQKGTGRARAGSRRSPLWIGGGVTFGPQPRVRTLKINKDLKKRILGDIFWNLLDNNNVFCLDWSATDKPKTAEIFKLLKDLNLHDTKLNILVDPNDLSTQASFANIPNVHLILFDEANAYYLAAGTKLILLKKDLDKFKNMVLKCV